MNHEENDKLVLIDVRGAAEFQAHHITGSFNIPLDSITADRVEKLLENQNIRENETVYLICKSGMRSKMAQEKLTASLRHVICIEKGIDGLKSDNKIKFNKAETAVITLDRQVRITIGALIVAGILIGIFMHPAGYGLAGFVGLGFMISGITDWCGIALLIAKLPWNKTQSC